MADDKLRIVATVEDQYTGPLNKLKNELKGVGDESRRQAGGWKKDWDDLRVGAEKYRGVLGDFSPVLSKIGVGGLGAALSLGGVAVALEKFAGSTRQLSLMAKDIGLTVDQLRAFQGLGEKFGITADTMKGAAKNFSDEMKNLQQHGTDYVQLQAMNLGKLAEDLASSKNMEEAIERGLDGLKNIPDPVIRRRVSRLLFGTDDVGLISSNLTGTAKAALQEVQQQIGSIDKATEEASKRFEDNLGRVGRAFEKLKVMTLSPALGGAATVMEGAAEAIDTDPNDPKSRLKYLKKERQDLDAQLKALPDGSWKRGYIENRRNGLDEEIGAIERPAKPPGALDEKLDAQMRGQAVPPKVQRERAAQISDIEARLADARRRHDWNEKNVDPSEPKLAPRQRELADEIRKLTDELRRLREQGAGASVSPSSWGGSASGGSLIQRAAWGGFGGPLGTYPRSVGGSGVYGGAGGEGGGAGGSRGGASGPDLGDGFHGRPFGTREPAKGGQYTSHPPEAAGTYRPQRELVGRDLDDAVINTIAGEARLRSAGGADAVINNMFNRLGTRGWGPSRDLHDVARAPGQYAGYRRASADEAQYIRDRIKAVASGGVPDNTKGSNSFRASWYRGPWWKRHGRFGRDVAGNTFAYDPSIPNGPYAPYAEPKIAAVPPKPQVENDPDRFPNGAPRVLKPRSMAADPKVPGVVMDRRSPADGSGLRQIKPWTRVPAVPRPGEQPVSLVRPFDRNERASIDDVLMDVEAKTKQQHQNESFSEFYKRRATTADGYTGHSWGRREDQVQDRPRDGSGDSMFGSAAGMTDELNGTHQDNATRRGPDGLTYEEYLERGVQSRRHRESEFTPRRELSLDEIRKFRGPDRSVGNALMDRFYGSGAAGAYPAMQMPGAAAGGGVRGQLDIRLHGFPAGTQARASMDDLFKETNVSNGRRQMDMDRI